MANAGDRAVLEPVPEKFLAERLQTSFALPMILSIDGQSPEDLTDEVTAEVRKLESLMVALGYLEARVGVKGRGTVEDPLRFDPAPGLRYRIRSIRFEGLPAPQDAGVVAAVEAKLADATGMVALREVLEDLGSGVIFVLKEQGYAMASVGDTRVRLDQIAGRADVVVRVEAGPRMRFGTVSFQGSFRMDEDEAKAFVPFGSGEAYRASAVRDMRSALEGTGMFRRVRIEEMVNPDAPEVMDVSVRIWDRSRLASEQLQSNWLIPTILVLITIKAINLASPAFGLSLRRWCLVPVALMVGGSLLEVGTRLQSFLAQ